MHNDEIRIAIWGLDIPPHKKITLLCFLECAEGANGRNCSPGVEMIAQYVRKSPVVVKTDIKWLVERNLLIPNGLNIHKSRYNIGLDALGLSMRVERPAAPAIPRPVTDTDQEELAWLDDYYHAVKDGTPIKESRRLLAIKLEEKLRQRGVLEVAR